MSDRRQASPNAPTLETVLSVRHWSDRLFSFRITRPATFRFKSGEFIMLGLEVDGKPLLRAYSMASPAWDEELEFYSIKVPDGPLTSRLQNIQPGDKVMLGKKPVGTLVLDALTPGKRLYMFSTGTGIAPFASLIRDPETYSMYEQVILTQTTWTRNGLTFGEHLFDAVKQDPLVGEEAQSQLTLFTSTTRDDGYERNIGRITHLIESGRLFEELGVPPLNPETDRAMICGSMAMLNDMKAVVEAAGLTEGSNSSPGEFVVEKAFVG
ncbi:MAG: ferredoxin--NADP reductase [Rhodothalassiaceae bacterium]